MLMPDTGSGANQRKYISPPMVRRANGISGKTEPMRTAIQENLVGG